MKIGTKVRHVRRNGEKVSATVIGYRKTPRGDWATLRVGERGAADTYELEARPSKCTIINKEK